MGAGLDTKASAEDKQCEWSNIFCMKTVPNLHLWRERHLYTSFIYMYWTVQKLLWILVHHWNLS